ncbi:putative transcription factor MADS-type1 family [Medicago truncatula]|uniref:MADS-box transcription factor family protein n=1 Tax=Medicago truncatula TaxID=3880 RepID=G7JM29_MEDTR|nr:agamous-like MADS-box protein AGL80 [Medicago truncatula]AES87671.1 MADS-box transcription factor family protein [Medicago truncatula]RHN59505.1 putative transcription factor MADS-type1 family [Medicago truncatula]
MTRRKVKLAFIVNDAARKATYKKRKKGLLKKVAELSTLCGIDACAMVYGPYELQPEIWPSPEGVQSVLSKFMALHEFQKCKKMMNQETFLTQSVLKAEEKLKKQRKENREQEMTIIMSQCLNEGRVVHDNMSTMDMSYLAWLIDHKLKDVARRLEAWDNNDQNQIMAIQNKVQLEMAATVPPPPPLAPSINNDDIMQSQLLMDSMVAGNVTETVPFGEVNSGVWSDLLP